MYMELIFDIYCWASHLLYVLSSTVSTEELWPTRFANQHIIRLYVIITSLFDMCRVNIMQNMQ